MQILHQVIADINAKSLHMFGTTSYEHPPKILGALRISHIVIHIRFTKKF